MLVFMRFLFYPLPLILTLGCSTIPKRNFRYLEIPTSINKTPDKKLNPSEVREDIEQVSYALQKAYSGRRWLPSDEFQRLNGELAGVNGEIAAIELCRKIDAAFDKVSDNHLRAKFRDRNCFVTRNRVGSVGPNFYQGKELPWAVQSASKHGYKALLISIKSFPQSTDPVWNGFIQKVQGLLASSHLNYYRCARKWWW